MRTTRRSPGWRPRATKPRFSSRSSAEDLGFVLDYGKQDWNEPALALREFVSNAIDRSIRERGDLCW